MLVLYFTCVLGIGFATAFLCMPFTKSPSSTVSSIWVLENPPQIQAPSTASRIVQNVSSNQMRNKNDDFLSYIPQSFLLFLQRSNKTEDDEHVNVRLLSATFADLPAPALQWEQMPSAPVPRLDGYSVQIQNLLYVFSGYGSLDYVSTLSSTCFVLF